MNNISENDVDQILRSAKREPVIDMNVNQSCITSEVNNRRRKRLRKRIILSVLVPTSLLLFGFGGKYTAAELINLSVKTGHVNWAVSPTQYKAITKGNPELKNAYHILDAWLQSQESSNPATWNTAPFKSYKILDMSLNNTNHATAHIEILLNNNKWSQRTVPMQKVSGKWKVTIQKYGEPQGPRHGWVWF